MFLLCLNLLFYIYVCPASLWFIMCWIVMVRFLKHVGVCLNTIHHDFSICVCVLYIMVESFMFQNIEYEWNIKMNNSIHCVNAILAWMLQYFRLSLLILTYVLSIVWVFEYIIDIFGVMFKLFLNILDIVCIYIYIYIYIMFYLILQNIDIRYVGFFFVYIYIIDTIC